MKPIIVKFLIAGLAVLSMLTQATANAERVRIINAEVVGTGKLTWLGMTVYNATLFAPEGQFSEQLPHAIRIDYRFAFSRKQLASKSLEEIERIFGGVFNRRAALASLESVFQDVEKDDHITGIHYPGKVAEFYSGKELLGTIDDSRLASAFFDIWLHPQTSRPALRSSLLGDS